MLYKGILNFSSVSSGSPPDVENVTLRVTYNSKKNSDLFKFLPSSRRLRRFVIVSSPASLTLVSSSFVSSTSSGMIMLCVLSNLWLHKNVLISNISKL